MRTESLYLFSEIEGDVVSVGATVMACQGHWQMALLLVAEAVELSLTACNAAMSSCEKAMSSYEQLNRGVFGPRKRVLSRSHRLYRL